MSDKSCSTYGDAQLFEMLCQGNREAFDEVYTRYWDKLYVFVAKAIKDKDPAKDIVQEIFVSLWLRRESLKNTDSLSGYLFTAARFKGITYIQSNLKRMGCEPSLVEHFTGRQDTLNEQYAAKELNSFIDNEIEKLPEKMRQVYVLSRREQLSYNEISDMLQISDKTVKKQISNALKHFRLALNKSFLTIFL
jgi:RNA polymerase sigma-70 factor (ECF subfamily)